MSMHAMHWSTFEIGVHMECFLSFLSDPTAERIQQEPSGQADEAEAGALYKHPHRRLTLVLI